MSRLSPIETDIVKRLSAALEKGYPEAEGVVVFGSRARGTSHEDSDLDVAVILDTNRIAKDNWDRVWQVKWAVLEQLDAEDFPLSLMLIPKSEYETAESGVELEIRREGIPVWHRKKMR
jgi:predicted nucleotidyltransferase